MQFRRTQAPRQTDRAKPVWFCERTTGKNATEGETQELSWASSGETAMEMRNERRGRRRAGIKGFG